MGESSLVPVRFGVDTRTNSIIASGSEGDLGVVEAILMRLDEDTLHKHKTTVFWLANASAQSVQTPSSTGSEPHHSVHAADESVAGKPGGAVRPADIVVAETISNSVIVSAVPSLFEEIKRVIESLDRRPPMVKIDC